LLHRAERLRDGQLLLSCRALGCALVAAVAWLVATGALAAGDAERAQALFDRAQTLRQQGKYGDACPLLLESHSLDPALGTLLYLADCYEQTGKLASAWRAFRQAEATARARGDARATQAADAAAALGPRLARLAIRAADPHLFVWLDQVPVPANERMSTLVDVGSHLVEASLGTAPTWSRQVLVSRDGELVTVSIPALGIQRAVEEPAPLPAPGDADAEAGLGGQRIAALVIGGLALCAAGAGIGFAVEAKSTYDDSEEFCVDDQCLAEGLDLRDDAFQLATGADVSFVIAGVAAAGAVVLWLTAPEPATIGAAARLRGAFGPSGASATVEGSF
jgi:tetratricopeptide (TPR) repeat protein